MNFTDYYIQKKIQGGNINEYEKVFKKYYQPLCRHAYRYLSDMDLAEDIVQEFFYNFWKNRESLSPKLSFEAYLFQSIKNNSLHYLEHLKVRKQYAEQVVNDAIGFPPSEELSELSVIELNKIIETTLQQLPERCSRVFSLNRFEGKKYKEIAEILSISVKTVEADMGKALQRFRETLKEYNITSF
jgi:RNA polymerase sigma-70 factor, ECF subfamily